MVGCAPAPGGRAADARAAAPGSCGGGARGQAQAQGRGNAAVPEEPGECDVEEHKLGLKVVVCGKGVLRQQHELDCPAVGSAVAVCEDDEDSSVVGGVLLERARADVAHEEVNDLQGVATADSGVDCTDVAAVGVHPVRCLVRVGRRRREAVLHRLDCVSSVRFLGCEMEQMFAYCAPTCASAAGCVSTMCTYACQP
eukprot:28987-Rhodomonas_salina.1